MTAAEEFAARLAELEEQDEVPIYTNDEGVTFAYSRHEGVILLSTTRRNANMAMMLLFHVHVCRVLTSYFGELNEESIRDNFVIIYELLDELMDFGYPQSTDEKILKEVFISSLQCILRVDLPWPLTPPPPSSFFSTLRRKDTRQTCRRRPR